MTFEKKKSDITVTVTLTSQELRFVVTGAVITLVNEESDRRKM